MAPLIPKELNPRQEIRHLECNHKLMVVKAEGIEVMCHCGKSIVLTFEMLKMFTEFAATNQVFSLMV